MHCQHATLLLLSHLGNSLCSNHRCCRTCTELHQSYLNIILQAFCDKNSPVVPLVIPILYSPLNSPRCPVIRMSSSLYNHWYLYWPVLHVRLIFCNKFPPCEMEADRATKHASSKCSCTGERDESAHFPSKGAAGLNFLNRCISEYIQCF